MCRKKIQSKQLKKIRENDRTRSKKVQEKNPRGNMRNNLMRRIMKKDTDLLRKKNRHLEIDFLMGLRK